METAVEAPRFDSFGAGSNGRREMKPRALGIENEPRISNVTRQKHAAGGPHLTVPKSPYLRTTARRVDGRAKVVKTVEEMQLEEIEQKRREARIRRRQAEKRMEMSMQGTLVRCPTAVVEQSRRQLTVPKTPNFATDSRAAPKVSEIESSTTKKHTKATLLATQPNLRGSAHETSKPQAPMHFSAPRRTVAKSPRLSYRSKPARASVVLTQDELVLSQRKTFKARPMPQFDRKNPRLTERDLPRKQQEVEPPSVRSHAVPSNPTVATPIQPNPAREAKVPKNPFQQDSAVRSASRVTTQNRSSAERRSQDEGKRRSRPQRAISEIPSLPHVGLAGLLDNNTEHSNPSRFSTAIGVNSSYAETDISLSYEDGSTPWFEADVAAQDEE